MEWLLNLLGNQWNRTPTEFDLNGWRTNDLVDRSNSPNAPWGYSDTPLGRGYGSSIPRAPDWYLPGASLPNAPDWYDEKSVLNKLLQYKPGTFQQRMDIERMLMENYLQRGMMGPALWRGRPIRM